jgi:hypothetical protein
MESKELHLARGFGAASRIHFDFEKLESYDWKVKIRESIVSGIKKNVQLQNPERKGSQKCERRGERDATNGDL